ncbi:MAG: glycoside hydrolase family 38 C-terminal domain-containing protein [Eubacteriales bacterium]
MKTYMFCNAHLDPVWLWQWESGLSEAISTYRAASDFIDEYPDFIFNHNESLLYEWIEENEPELFAKIQRQVKEGRWEIIGGWFLQPDCNIPSGESIFRQVLRGRLYFYDKFDKVPVTAINFDSFGHAQGLVQMLEKCGYKNYVNIRPGRGNYDFDSEDFLWRGYDGESEILVHRSDKGYNSVLGKVNEELPGWIEQHKNEKTALYLWGVGNHGGGPSRIDLDNIAEMKKNGADIVHSTPDEYFRTVDREKLPVVERGLNPLMEGCYTSIVRIKQLHRRLENDLVMVEKMASHAAIAGLSDYEKEKIDDAWRDLLFAEFHDSLPGSCIQPVEDDTIRMLDHGLEITNKLKAKYFLALCAGQEKISDANTVPLMVYNPHPFTYTQPIDVEFLLPRQMWHKEFSNPVVYQDGRPLRSQQAKESGNFYMDWCKRVIFDCELPPCSMSRFDIHFDIIEKRPEPQIKPDKTKIVVETAHGRVVVNTRTGLVDSYEFDGKEYLKPGAFAVEIFHDSLSCWDGKPVLDLRYPLGRFNLMTPGQATDFSGVKGGIVQPVRVTDEGDMNAVIEADFSYNNSRLLMRYIVDKVTGILETEVRVFYHESEKRLKLCVPTTLEGGKYIGQTIFGREELHMESGDVVSQYWQTAVDDEYAMTIIDDGIYGSDYNDGTVRLTLVRSAGYGSGRSAWGEPFHEPMYQQRMDQGERRYRFRFMAGRRGEMLSCADREAAMFNQKAYALPFCPSGRGVKPKALISIDKENVALSCFKRSERDENVYILRMFEGQGTAVTAHIELPVLGLSFDAGFKPFEIRTYKIENGTVTETDMLEGAVPLEK